MPRVASAKLSDLLGKITRVKSPQDAVLSDPSTAGQALNKTLLFLRVYTLGVVITGSAEEGFRKLKSAQDGDFAAFAKFLTWLESTSITEALALEELLKPKHTAFRIGITGPPGAGKSTLVGRLITRFRRQNLKVGVMAVDPSSPFSKGAILGDRIRYSEHFTDAKVFIRSLGTRGSLGGLSGSAFLMARAFDVCEFDVLLIETVGVGQTELDVLHVADKVCVVLVPESGDSIQAMKAGLMEIADIFVVNKSDRPGADGLVREIEASIHDGLGKNSQVFKVTASEDKGVEELFVAFEKFRSENQSQRTSPERLKEEARALLRTAFENSVDKKLSQVNDLKSFRALFEKDS